MQDINKLIVVDSSVLPEIILKVLGAKRMIARGEAKSSVDACKAVGISRSAYYKYRDSVFSYEEKMTRQIISLYVILKDEPGVLSSILSALHEMEANVLTVNQSIPVDSVAAVTISFRFNNDKLANCQIESKLSRLYGVVDIKLISCE